MDHGVSLMESVFFKRKRSNTNFHNGEELLNKMFFNTIIQQMSNNSPMTVTVLGGSDLIEVVH